MLKTQMGRGFLAGMLVLFFIHLAPADEAGKGKAELPPDGYLSRGMKEFTLSGGVGSKIPLHRFIGRSKTHFLALVPSVGYFIRNRQELLLEVPILHYNSPQNGAAAGADVMYRYYFRRNRRFAPFVEAGAGANYVGLNIPDLTGKFQFSLQSGIGVRSKISDRADIVVSLRWHHFSNAGTHDPNIGTNDSFLLIGYSHYF